VCWLKSNVPGRRPNNLLRFGGARAACQQHTGAIESSIDRFRRRLSISIWKGAGRRSLQAACTADTNAAPGPYARPGMSAQRHCYLKKDIKPRGASRVYLRRVR